MRKDGGSSASAVSAAASNRIGIVAIASSPYGRLTRPSNTAFSCEGP
jgi:hypothetical protein